MENLTEDAPPSSSVQNQNNNKSSSVHETSEISNNVEITDQDTSLKSTISDIAAPMAASDPAQVANSSFEESSQVVAQFAEGDMENQQICKINQIPAVTESAETSGLTPKKEHVPHPFLVTDMETGDDSCLIPKEEHSCKALPDAQANVLEQDLQNSSPTETSSGLSVEGQNDEEKCNSFPNTVSAAETSLASPTQEVETELEASASCGAEAGGSIVGKNVVPGQGESVYYVKWILFNNSKVPIITQNENGPCPLLAVMNVLLLKGKVHLAPIVEMITSEQLMAHLGECVFESMPKNLDETARANYEQNMQDAMDLMHKLQTGLDVNVKFTGVSDFEYTSECIIFDLLEIGLYHGWLVDPQDEENVKVVGKCSYNQLVEKIIQYKQSDNDDLVREALIAEQFLSQTAAQLTYHGLCELSSTVREQELCVFFRNNHFGTLYKHNNELFLLVTDQGFLTESNVVWETLSNVDGNCHFVDANFATYTKAPLSTKPIAGSPYSSGDEQISSDYQVALSLQHHDEQLIAEQEEVWGQFHNEFGPGQNSDHELALRLQEEEDRQAAAALQEQRGQQAQGQGQAMAAGMDRRPRDREERREKKEGKDCCVL